MKTTITRERVAEVMATLPASDAEAMLEALLDAARDADEEDEPHNRNALLEAAAAVWEAYR